MRVRVISWPSVGSTPAPLVAFLPRLWRRPFGFLCEQVFPCFSVGLLVGPVASHFSSCTSDHSELWFLLPIRVGSSKVSCSSGGSASSHPSSPLHPCLATTCTCCFRWSSSFPSVGSGWAPLCGRLADSAVVAWGLVVVAGIHPCFNLPLFLTSRVRHRFII